MSVELRSAPSSLEELPNTFDRIESDLINIQRELDQALGVWRNIVDQEQKDFKKALEAEEKSIEEQTAAFQKQKEAYEKNIAELENYFQSQLKTTEQNALRAMNELDEAWQRDKLSWQHTSGQQLQDVLQQRDALLMEKQQQDVLVQTLRQELTRLQNQAHAFEERQRLLETQWQQQQTTTEAQVVDLQNQKTLWHQSLTQRMEETRQREALWATQHQRQEALVHQLQDEVVQLQGRLAEAERYRKPQVESYVSSLEAQVQALNDFIKQYLPAQASHPLRRKTDFYPYTSSTPSS